MRFRAFSVCFILLALCVLFVPMQAAADNAHKVYVISLKGEINPAMSAFVRNRIEQANLAKADGILIDISTLGGLVNSALDIKDSIIGSDVPVAVFIGDRAASAGALISVAADKIIMAPGSHFGSAEPVPYSEKAVAFISGEFHAAAELRGRDPLIAAGMADKDLDLPGFPKGKLVDLTAEQAKELGYADAVASSVQAALDYMGWGGASVIEAEPDYKVKAAQFLTRSDVASILLTIGIIAFIIEIFVQGFGIAGAVGIISFLLYFGGGYLAGTTEWWDLILFAAGIIFLIIELAVPGFGIFGILGIISLILGIVFAAPDPVQGLTSLGISVLAAVVITPLLYKFFGGARLFRRLTLTEAETAESGYVSTPPGSSRSLIGLCGEAVTPLRPAGTVLIDGRRLDVVSDGTYMQPGTRVRVIRVEGSRIVVEESSGSRTEEN